jgi:hypothetical protein
MITKDTILDAAAAAAEAPAAPRVSAHANCDHPKTKAARAACRRARNSDWIDVTRGHELAAKGSTVRVHTEDDMLEGVLLGWGSKTIILRVDDERVTLKTADALRVEGSRKGAQNDA